MNLKIDDGMIMDFDVTLPKEGQKLTVYADFLLKLQGKSRFFDRSLGYISWLQGKVLNMARKQCKRGDWKKFVCAIQVAPGKTMTLETAQKLRKIANHIIESQAIIKSYSDMLEMVYPSYAKGLKHDVEHDESILLHTRKKRNKGVKTSKSQPLHPDKYQKILGGLLRDSQRLASGMSEVGISPTDEVDLCRDCIRLAISAINELESVKAHCNTMIRKYPEAPTREAA